MRFIISSDSIISSSNLQQSSSHTQTKTLLNQPELYKVLLLKVLDFNHVQVSSNQLNHALRISTKTEYNKIQVSVKYYRDFLFNYLSWHAPRTGQYIFVYLVGECRSHHCFFYNLTFTQCWPCLCWSFIWLGSCLLITN